MESQLSCKISTVLTQFPEKQTTRVTELWLGRRSRTRPARWSKTGKGAATKQQTKIGSIKPMKKIKLGLLAMASACLLAALPAQANLVVNGDFEAGFASWTTLNAVITGDAHSGLKAAQLLPATSLVDQDLPALVPFQKYNLDFWAKANGVGTLTVALDSTGIPAFQPTITLATGPASYTHYSVNLTPTTIGHLSFFWADGGSSSSFVDDVSVTPVPEPTTMLAGAMLLLPFGASTLRVLRRNRVAVA